MKQTKQTNNRQSTYFLYIIIQTMLIIVVWVSVSLYRVIVSTFFLHFLNFVASLLRQSMGTTLLELFRSTWYPLHLPYRTKMGRNQQHWPDSCPGFVGIQWSVRYITFSTCTHLISVRGAYRISISARANLRRIARLHVCNCVNANTVSERSFCLLTEKIRLSFLILFYLILMSTLPNARLSVSMRVYHLSFEHG